MNSYELNNRLGNYNSVFNPLPSIPFNGNDPKSGFTNHRFMNKNQLLHNDIRQIVLDEEITEYSVLIDSKDRNYQVYPDPFAYEVRFNPIITKEYVNGRVIKYEEPNPIINDSFKNVRYIKLEDAILPLYTCVKKVKHNCQGEITEKWSYDTSRPLTDNLYVVLSIGEYKDVNYRSTNEVLSESFATIYYDYCINSTHYKGYTHNGIKVFYPDQLGKIDKLRISFQDPLGKPLTVKHVDKRIKSNMECFCDDDNQVETCYKHNYFHPMNPIYQHHLHFKVGVVEPRLNKQTFN